MGSVTPVEDDLVDRIGCWTCRCGKWIGNHCDVCASCGYEGNPNPNGTADAERAMHKRHREGKSVQDPAEDDPLTDAELAAAARRAGFA